jgi:hypothetical protein
MQVKIRQEILFYCLFDLHFSTMTNGVFFTQLKSLYHTTLQQKSLHPNTLQLSLGSALVFSGNRKWLLPIWSCSTVLERERERVTKCRKMRLIEGNAKCCHLKKCTCKGALRQVFFCLRPRTHTPPPPTHTLYTGGGGSWIRKKETGATWGEYSTDHTAGLKIPIWVNVCKKLAISTVSSL